MAVVAQMERKHGPLLSDAEGWGIAENIQKQRPGWMVVFGVYSREFVAFPLFAVSRRTILTARYPDALLDRMVRAEHERPHELVITNPDDPEKGQLHVDFEHGYMSWERVVWDFWGTVTEGLGEEGTKVVTRETVVWVLGS